MFCSNEKLIDIFPIYSFFLLTFPGERFIEDERSGCNNLSLDQKVVITALCTFHGPQGKLK